MTLSERELEFIRESSAIEDITNIDYRMRAREAEDQGHVGAWLIIKRLAREGEPLTLSALERAQGLLLEEQRRFGHPVPRGGAGVIRSPKNGIDVRVGGHIAPSFTEVPALIEAWLHDYNAARAPLAHVARSDYELVMTLGALFQRFEALHPFADGNGRVGRMLLNGLCTMAAVPVIIVRADERPAFYPAHRSKRAMQRFMADKLREAISCFTCAGGVMSRVHTGMNSDRYRCESCGAEVVAEWHALIPIYEDQNPNHKEEL